jgi:hypothetical protein
VVVRKIDENYPAKILNGDYLKKLATLYHSNNLPDLSMSPP